MKKSKNTNCVTDHTFSHRFAPHLIERGYDIRTVQELLGPKDVGTTMIYTHVLNKSGRDVKSPADFLPPVQENAPSVIMHQAHDKHEFAI